MNVRWRAHTAAKACGIKLIIGAEITLTDGLRLVLLATDKGTYGHLSVLITQARRRIESNTIFSVGNGERFSPAILRFIRRFPDTTTAERAAGES